MNRGVEIAAEVADSVRSTIVEQVANGVSVGWRCSTSCSADRPRSIRSPPRRCGMTHRWAIEGVAPARWRPDRRCYVDGRRAVDERPTGAQVIDADGLIALPGLVDLHTHLREPGREDAETVETGTRAAALGGFTAVHAMANTEPVADVAGVVEQVWRLGRPPVTATSRPVGAVTVGLAGERLAELGAMADSAARVRVSPTTATACTTRC